MFKWFATTQPQPVHLTLSPDESGKKYAGFQSGKPLTLTGIQGETIGTLMGKFNQYRGPTEQINRIYTQNGELISNSTVLDQDLIAVVRHT